tara:strand:+ start:1596 stop:2414 length:819 start_codon:yes stop_codon:yes gene_type:complete
LKKINFIIPKRRKEKITKIIECFDNISYRFLNDKVKFEIFSDKLDQDIFLLNNLCKDIPYALEKVVKKNWIKEIKKKDITSETDLFVFHQGFRKISKTKNKIIIPASSAFGTGSHESTILIIKSFEKIIKKVDFNLPLDIGTGTGILSFILNIKLKKKIYATDISLDSKNNFQKNKKINKLNNLIFIKCYGMDNIILKKKKFDLIVANLLFNEHKRVIVNVCKSIKKKGFYFISGILDTQANYFIVLLRSLNLRLYNLMKLNGWVCLVFIKY